VLDPYSKANEMPYNPKTLKEARKHKYGAWAGNPRGIMDYMEGYCASEIYLPSDCKDISYQCSRKNGYGPRGLYCKQHAKKLTKGMG